MLDFFLILFSSFFSSTFASHFLGGSFTYRHIPQPNNTRESRLVLVEVRFHISNHYFLCTSEQVNNHLIVYLIGASIPYDSFRKQYLWFETPEIRSNQHFYDIQCLTAYNNQACHGFSEKTWGYCESANNRSGYSILRRHFLLSVQTHRPIFLTYVCRFMVIHSYCSFCSRHVVGRIQWTNNFISIYRLQRNPIELIHRPILIFQHRTMLMRINQETFKSLSSMQMVNFAMRLKSN